MREHFNANVYVFFFRLQGKYKYLGYISTKYKLLLICFVLFQTLCSRNFFRTLYTDGYYPPLWRTSHKWYFSLALFGSSISYLRDAYTTFKRLKQFLIRKHTKQLYVSGCVYIQFSREKTVFTRRPSFHDFLKLWLIFKTCVHISKKP